MQKFVTPEPEKKDLEKVRKIKKMRKNNMSSLNTTRKAEKGDSYLPSLSHGYRSVSRNRYDVKRDFTDSMLKCSLKDDLGYTNRLNPNFKSVQKERYQPVAMGNGVFSGLVLNGASSSPRMVNMGIPLKKSFLGLQNKIAS